MNPPGLPNRSIKLYTNTNPLQLPLPIAFNQRLDVIVAGDAGGERLGVQVAKYALVSGVRLGDLFGDEFGLNPDMQVMTLRDEREGAWFIDGGRGEMRSRRAWYRRAAAIGRYRRLGPSGASERVWTLFVPTRFDRAIGAENDRRGSQADLTDMLQLESNRGHVRWVLIVLRFIDVDLQAKTSSGFARAKSLLGKWDKAWDVWVLGAEDAFKGRTRLPKQATAEALVLEDVLVPTTLPGGQAEDEAWVELFEWVGLCSLGARGSPRIRCQDQASSYVACYSPPEGCRVGSVLRFRWNGFISEGFVQECLRIAQCVVLLGGLAQELTPTDARIETRLKMDW
ncbi:hypothetical protein RhiJN_16713 [Ceratobasidium sp. AG-Ba]|nr:hypothetical protein RhiJN_16713 [Ceratobasidium sp. AG-Ba]